MIYKKVYLIGLIVILSILLTGCIGYNESEVKSTTREFIKDYIPNPETIQFNDEIIKFAYNGGLDVYGSGTVLYEGTRQPFSYWIFVGDGNKCVVKQITIGEV